MLKKSLSSQGTLTAFINMKIDKYFNMKILNIHNILLTKSLKGFLPILQNINADVHRMISNSHGWAGIPDAIPACTTTLLGGLRSCWILQRQGTLQEIEKKLAQPSSSHTNLNRRGVGRRRVTVELSSFVICKDKKRDICVSLGCTFSRHKSFHQFMTSRHVGRDEEMPTTILLKYKMC